ncbi:hypothetical protein FN846DRAFT_966810 [Sphaerosporella brunnea]|uniref:AhpC/TSA antioxidant enzyme-domain-containing protein n=1 Tax=Sphaerosporella brunnea TaxID=1250544 RepID=A0A5J5EMT9_9PEZI|nr:hypothetical protein FN846DRAFT_966810 [Sphaerosporella brunnea]
MSTSLTSEPLPTSVEKILDLTVLSNTGESIKLETLVSSPSRVLIVFIRHFYCGSCQDYVRALVADPALTPSTLAEKGQKLIVVGCGDYSLIDSYKQELSATWDFYSDPSGGVYDALSMSKSLALGEKPKYISTGMISAVWHGIMGGIKGGPTKGGNITRIGGEFLWVDQKLVWCHRMKNTRDHLEVEQVVKLFNDWPDQGA